MIRILASKVKEASASVFPVTLIVLLLNLTPLVNFSGREVLTFLFCALALVIGMALFNLGADMAMTPMGEQTGAGLPKSGRLIRLLLACFVMGAFVTVAEPDLSVLASQVRNVIPSVTLMLTIGFGVGAFLVLALLRVVFRLHLSHLMTFFYLLLFALAALLVEQGRGDFLPLAFDSGGVTTGPITVPFIMALGVGVASALGDRRDRENSFGFIALCSIGPILAVLFLGLFFRGDIAYRLPSYGMAQGAREVVRILLSEVRSVAVALLPILLFFGLLQVFVLKLPRRRILQIAVGAVYTFFGLVVFLSAVEVGFMPIGFKMGVQLAQRGSSLTVLFAFLLGMAVVLAEPAVHVLNRQVEAVTDGGIKKRSMLIALCCGVGVAVALSILRAALGFSILYYLIPGYFLSLGLSFFVPKIYTAIAFDSGGVASGPLTSTFIFPFVIGACATLQGESAVLSFAFGMVAMVAMTPLITIQLLGFQAILSRKLRERLAMRRILGADDKQIIRFL